MIMSDFLEYDPIDADVMIVDPPYSAHVHKNATSQSAGGGTRHRDLGFDHLTPTLRRAIAAQAAHVQRWGIIYSDIEGAHRWVKSCTEAGASYIRSVPWVRWSMPQLSGDRPPQGCEMVLLFHGRAKGKKHWNGPGNLTHLSHTCLRGEDKHKCEKPLDQVLDLVSWFSDENDTIVDPCAGHGTVGLAASILHRGYLGFEIDPTWRSKADKRLAGGLKLKRDIERYEKWLVAREIAHKDEQRREAITAKARAKNEERKCIT